MMGMALLGIVEQPSEHRPRGKPGVTYTLTEGGGVVLTNGNPVSNIAIICLFRL